MPQVELKIKLPDDTLVRYSTAHLEAEFRMFASRSTANGLVVIVEAETAEPEALLHTFDENPDIYSYEVFYTDQRSVLFQIEADEHPSRTAARAAGIIPQYPMILRDWWLRIETITSWDRLSQLKTEFKKADVPFEILSVTQQVDVTTLLTDRQWDVLTEAVSRGYYDTPRTCTLTELATALDVNPSAVSGVLHRAEEHIIKHFVTDARPISNHNSR